MGTVSSFVAIYNLKVHTQLAPDSPFHCIPFEINHEPEHQYVFVGNRMYSNRGLRFMRTNTSQVLAISARRAACRRTDPDSGCDYNYYYDSTHVSDFASLQTQNIQPAAVQFCPNKTEYHDWRVPVFAVRRDTGVPMTIEEQTALRNHLFNKSWAGCISTCSFLCAILILYVAPVYFYFYPVAIARSSRLYSAEQTAANPNIYESKVFYRALVSQLSPARGAMR